MPEPEKLGELDKVIRVVDGLLRYNPDERFKIDEALTIMLNGNGIPTLPAKPPIYGSYVNATLGDSISSQIGNIFSFLFTILTSKGHNYVNYIILDRAFAYTISVLDILKSEGKGKEQGEAEDEEENPLLNPTNVKIIGIASLIISSSLFNAYGSGFTFRDGYAYIMGEDPLKEKIRAIIQKIITSVPLLGKTLLDEMTEHPDMKSWSKYEKLGFLNVICFQLGLYQKYRDRIPDLTRILISLVQTDFPLLPKRTYFDGSVSTTVGRRYFNINAVADHIERMLNETIVGKPNSASGGKRKTRKNRKGKKIQKN
jgi:hypothetical protein